tara:strand:- start:643 stop:1539 length:897 start_codon:yes stop_codon:yes gene_type:complete
VQNEHLDRCEEGAALSGRTSNLTFNTVDWARHQRLTELLAAGEGPVALATYLRSLGLKATDNHRRRLARLEERVAAGHPSGPEWLDLLIRLNCDPEGYADRAAELAHDPAQCGPARQQLLELAFVNGRTRWFGDLSLTRPSRLLSWFSPRYRDHNREQVRALDFLCEELAELLGADAAREVLEPPKSVPPGVGPVVRALGGLPTEEIPVLEPLDAVWSPVEVQEIAEQLADVQVLPVPGDDRLLRALISLNGEDEDEDDMTADPLAALIDAELEQLRLLYVKAAAAGQGVDIHWHPNP